MYAELKKRSDVCGANVYSRFIAYKLFPVSIHHKNAWILNEVRGCVFKKDFKSNGSR